MEIQPKCTILIVDDLPTNIEVLANILSPEYSVFVAKTGEKALEIARSSPEVGLILLDIMMPGMDGYNVCHSLKTDPRTQYIPVIFISAKSEEGDEVHGLEVGAVDYITKPISPAIVLARVKTHLALTAAMKKLERQNAILSENVRLREDIERMSNHDLKGPLTAFVDIPEMLSRDTSLSSDHLEMLGILTKSANLMLEMINRSSDLFKMEQGTYKLVSVPVNLVKIVNQIFQEYIVMAKKKEIQCSLSINGNPSSKEDVFEANGEEFLFFSMLSNLIKNAIEASPDGGAVVASLYGSPCLTMAIKNQGIIPHQIRERIFKRYATFGKTYGTGLGLYTAALTAKVLGGAISFTSSESDGTTFRVTLTQTDQGFTTTIPLQERIPETIASHPRRKPKAETKVLVVDDYQYMRRIIMNILRQDGFGSFLEAENGEHAISTLKVNPVDLVICDWDMPEATGPDVLKFMSGEDRLKDIPFIMVTGNISLPELEKASEKGIRNFIVKPFSPDILRKKVEAVLSNLPKEVQRE